MIESFRRLWPFIRPFKKDLVWLFLTGAGVAAVSGFLPILIQLLIGVFNKGSVIGAIEANLPSILSDRVDWLRTNQNSITTWIPFGFPLLFLVLGVFRFAHFTLLNLTSERIVSSIRMALVRKIMRLNLTYHGSLERGSGGLISRVFSDTSLLQQGLNFYVTLIREPVQAFVFLGIMIWQDWRLTMFALIFLPFFLFVTRRVAKSLRKYGARGRESMEDLTSVLKDSLDGIRVVQSFNLEKEMERRFDSSLKTYLGTAKQIIFREQAVSPLNEFVTSFLIMGFAMYSINQVLGGHTDSAKFIGFLSAAALLQAPIKKLQDTAVQIQQAIVVTQRIFSVLDSPSEVPESSNPKPFPANWQTITFKNVSFSYGGQMTLKQVNLTVRRGEIIALVGESGSGKSTLVNLLERFYDPTEGEILVDGTPIREIGLRDLRHNVALVTQDVFLFRDTIERNIQAGDFTKDTSEIEAAAKLANAHGFISNTSSGYQSPVGERGSFLSGGEKQRVSIARAMFKNAPILILDEATSALDSVSEMEVQKGLNHLLEGRTAFVIAHRLSTVFNANRILVMRKGEIVEQGDHQSLLALKGEYFNFFNLQMSQDHRLRQTTTT